MQHLGAAMPNKAEGTLAWVTYLKMLRMALWALSYAYYLFTTRELYL